MAIAKPISKKEHIRSTARKMFRERGYAATSMRDIAREVGIEAPSLYAHFSAKEVLLHEICFDMAERFFQRFTESVNNNSKPIQQLEQAIEAHISIISEFPEDSVVFFHEWIFLSEPALSQFKKLRSDYEKRFRAIIKNGIENQDFKSVDIRITTFALLSSMNAVYDFARLSNKVKPDEFSNHISKLFLKGLKK